MLCSSIVNIPQFSGPPTRGFIPWGVKEAGCLWGYTLFLGAHFQLPLVLFSKTDLPRSKCLCLVFVLIRFPCLPFHNLSFLALKQKGRQAVL